MQIVAENHPEMMQIELKSRQNDANQPWFWKGAEFMQIRWEPTAQTAKKLSGDALLHDLTISEFLAR